MYPSTACNRPFVASLITGAAGALSAMALSITLALSLSQSALSAPASNSASATPDAEVRATTPKIPAGSVLIRDNDPLTIYRESGIDKEQEYKIRKLAKDFEEQQRVRLKLMANYLKDMRKLELMPDPDEKKTLDKQSEINKLQAEIGTERTKLLLAIRNVLTFEQKERLVQNIQKRQASLFENK